MKNVFFSILLLLFGSLEAQIDPTNSPQNFNSPTIIRPSPVVENFMRYGEIPVDHSTGVPKIEIPIYTIEGKQLKLPLSISYHASGVKVHDVPSEVGIGWVLNAGGIFARTALDYKDELKGGTRAYANAEQFLATAPNILYNTPGPAINGVMALESYFDTEHNHEDLISDRYFYLLPDGTSGVFRFNYPQDDTVITLPYRPYKIIRTPSAGFIITDDKGISYTYEKADDGLNAPTEYIIKEIISKDGTEKITFNYTTVQSTASAMSVNTFVYPKNFKDGYSCDPRKFESYPTDFASGSIVALKSKYLSSIESEDVVINFTYADREDLQNLKRIIEIKIASKKRPNVTKRRVVFNQSYFGSKGIGWGVEADKRLRLNSMSLFGEDSSEPQNHSFTYEESVSLPPYYSHAYDFWGYYNGTNNGTAIHNDFILTQYRQTGYGGNRRADNGAFSKAGMLKEITYPTGGRTAFEFERAFSEALYLYNGSNTSGYIGGFRVSKITNYTKNNEVANVKSYQYDGIKFTPVTPEYFNITNRYADFYVYSPPNQMPGDNIELVCNVQYRRDITTSEPIISNTIAPGLPVIYGEVTEIEGTAQNNLGQTIYTYTLPDDFTYTGELREYHSFQNDIGNYEPKLTNKTTKSKTGTKLMEEINSYSDHFVQEYTTGINITKSFELLMLKSLYFIMGWYYMQMDFVNFRPEYLMFIKAHDTKATQKATLLDNSLIKIYDQADPTKYIQESTNYIYNQSNLMAKEISFNNSLGENVVTQYKYPLDYAATEPYQTLLTKNIITPVIEQTVLKNNKQVHKVQRSYKNWGNNIIEPEIVKAQNDAANPLESIARYLSYDTKGNPVTLKQEVGSPTTYLWGYNKALPIAAVENAIYVSETVNNDQMISFSGLQIPMGNTTYDLGEFQVVEEKDYKIDRMYERYPDNYSVMYQVNFENVNDNTGSAFFTDNTPPSGNNFTFTSQSVHLKPGIYKIKLINIGYNGYQGQIENNFNFTVYDATEVSIPFHTSFEEDISNINTTSAITGKKSHTGLYKIRFPQSTLLGYDKVIVSYWTKSGVAAPWQYVENVVSVSGNQLYTIGSYEGYIDEVRVYPPDARMKTFTYDPFYKTQTSIMQENGQTQYYNYDSFGRLKEEYKMEGNVKKLLKSANYHYKP